MKRILSVAFLLFFLTFTGYNHAFSQATYEEFDSLTLYLGQIKVVPVKKPTRVVISNPKIADINSISPEEMVLIAKEAGATDIVWWDSFGQHVLRLEVFPENLSVLKEHVDEILKDLNLPDVISRSAETEGKIFLLGSVKEEKDKERIKLAFGKIQDKLVDLIKVKEEEATVEIGVQLIELGQDAQKKLGFTMPTSITANEQAGQNDGTLRGTADALFHVFQWKRDLFSATFDALAEEGKVKILSRPRLACQSGKEADLLVGGETPIFSSGVVSGGGTSTSVEYKEYGIKLKIKPTITEEGQIKVNLKVEISEIGDALSIGGGSAGITARASPLMKRNASTELVLADGQTMAIGGLIKRKTLEGYSKVLGLGDIPILGILFRRKETSSGGNRGALGDTELFITLTPKILKKEESEIPKEGEQIKAVEAFPRTKEIAPVSALPQEETSTLVARYTQMVTKHIKDNLVYPWAASQGRLEGVMRLSLNIDSTGQLLDVKITQSSGFAVLDENTLKTVKQVAPFSSFPSGINQHELWIEIPIVYNLKK